MAMHLFMGYGYYPESGLGDYQGPVETIEEVEEKFAASNLDWFSVVEEVNGRLREIASGWGKR